jgi:hypothetical protein
MAVDNKKTHDRCQPWVLVEIRSSATSPGGVGNDDDQIHRLQRPKIHAAGKLMVALGEVKRGFWWGIAARQPRPTRILFSYFFLLPSYDQAERNCAA